MDNYGQIQARMMELIPYQFVETHNKFAIKRNYEDEAQKDVNQKTYSRDEFETLMLLLSSYMYFKDDPTIFEVYNFKAAFLLRFPEYITNYKHKLTVYMHEAYNIIKRNEFRTYLTASSNCVVIEYIILLNKLISTCK